MAKKIIHYLFQDTFLFSFMNGVKFIRLKLELSTILLNFQKSTYYAFKPFIDHFKSNTFIYFIEKWSDNMERRMWSWDVFVLRTKSLKPCDIKSQVFLEKMARQMSLHR